MIDNYSRECLALHVASSIRSADVTAVLDRVIEQRRKPTMITLDNGTEFTSSNFDAWAWSRSIHLDFIRPGKPIENSDHSTTTLRKELPPA